MQFKVNTEVPSWESECLGKEVAGALTPLLCTGLRQGVFCNVVDVVSCGVAMQCM